MNIAFDTPTNVAFQSLGALPPGQHWSRFDVPGKAAAIGQAHVLVTSIWNYHWSKQGAKRVAKGPAIYRNIQDASLWYRMGRPSHESPPTHVAHWNRIMLAREKGVRIVGVLKDFSTSQCSLQDTFDCNEVLDDINGGAAWIRLRPSRPLSIEVTAVNIREHVGGGGRR
jgi:hypothetical protein